MDYAEKALAILYTYRYARMMLNIDNYDGQQCKELLENVQILMPEIVPNEEPEKKYETADDPHSIRRRGNRVHGGDIPAEFPTKLSPSVLYARQWYHSKDRNQRLHAIVNQVNKVMAGWDEEDREIIKRKYLSGDEIVEDKVVLQSLKADGYRLTQKVYRNAKEGALANLATSIKEVA